MSTTACKASSSEGGMNGEFVFPAGSIECIRADLWSVNVRVFRSEGSDVRLVYNSSRPRLRLECALEDGILEIRQKPRVLAMMYPTTLDIYIPAGYDRDLFVNANSGDVSMQNFKFRNLTLNFFSGNITTEALTASNLVVNVSSGIVNVGSVEATSFTIGGSSMKVSVSNCIVKDAVIAGTSGSVDLQNCEGNFDVSFTSANVRLAYKKFDGNSASIATTSGNIVLELPASAEFLLESHVTSGQFQSDFPIARAEDSDERNIAGWVGTKENKILLRATSGSINIVKAR